MGGEEVWVSVHKKTLLRITASLVFSLTRLHKEELGGVFLRLCEKTLELAGGSGAGYQGLGGVAMRRFSERAVGGGMFGSERWKFMIDGGGGDGGFWVEGCGWEWKGKIGYRE